TVNTANCASRVKSRFDPFTEDLKSLEMTVVVPKRQALPNIFGGITASDIGVVLQENDFWDKGIAEIGSGFVEFLPVNKAGRKIIANKSSEDGSNNAKSASDKRQFIGSKIHFWLIVLSGGFIGIGIGLLIVYCSFLIHNEAADHLQIRA
ncbi:MAG: hypothetical protein KJ573_16120, partial [Proteobacteria bacterium]|nr:hypothetical protein [Pseudomonadota bacterium]